MENGLASPLPVLSMPLAFAGCTAPKVFENVILTAAAAVPVLLALAPMVVWVKTKCMVKTLRLMRTPSLWAAVINSVIWVLFSFIAAKRVECMELILAYPILLSLDFIYLLMGYGHHNNPWKASFLSLLVLSCLGFVFYAIKFEFFLPMSSETILGIAGLLILLASHGFLIEDITSVDGAMEFSIAVMNVVSPGFLNMVTCYVILKNHPEQQYIAYSGLIGFFCAIIEIMLLISRWIHDKFLGGSDGAPAIPPDQAAQLEAHATLAAQVQAVAASVARLEAYLQAAAPRYRGDEVRIAVNPADDNIAGGQQQGNTAQDVSSGIQEEGSDLGDHNLTPSSKDLPSIELSEEMTAVPEEVKLAELERKMTQQPQAGTGDRNAGETKMAKSETKFLLSGSCDGDSVKEVESGKNESKPESSGQSKSVKSQVLAPTVSSGGSCAPRGWRKYLFRDTRPMTC